MVLRFILSLPFIGMVIWWILDGFGVLKEKVTSFRERK